MQPSYVRTVTLQEAGASDLGAVVKAPSGKSPYRVLVKNVGGVLAFLSFSTQDLNPVGTETFRLPPGDSEVFVLAPEQSLYAVGSGPGGSLSIAVSEAFTFDIRTT